MDQLWSALIAAAVSLIIAGGGWLAQSRRFEKEREDAKEERRHELDKLKREHDLQRETARQQSEAELAAQRRKIDKANIRFILLERPDWKFRTLNEIRRRIGPHHTDDELRALIREAGALEERNNRGGPEDKFFLPPPA